MEENKNLEQNLDNSNEKLHISDVISSKIDKPHDAYIKLDNGEEYRVYVDPEVYYK